AHMGRVYGGFEDGPTLLNGRTAAGFFPTNIESVQIAGDFNLRLPPTNLQMWLTRSGGAK
ncbi:MAG: hypothetical protein JSU74_01230, partial [Candidatus Zixiibacteriota bacterium]